MGRPLGNSLKMYTKISIKTNFIAFFLFLLVLHSQLIAFRMLLGFNIPNVFFSASRRSVLISRNFAMISRNKLEKFIDLIIFHSIYLIFIFKAAYELYYGDLAKRILG